MLQNRIVATDLCEEAKTGVKSQGHCNLRVATGIRTGRMMLQSESKGPSITATTVKESTVPKRTVRVERARLRSGFRPRAVSSTLIGYSRATFSDS